MLDDIQNKQEGQYHFPYHYLVDYRKQGTSFFKYWAWSINYLGRIHLVIKTLEDLYFERLLDIGCGDGKLLSILSEYFDSDNVQYKGIDYSEQAIELANAL